MLHNTAWQTYMLHDCCEVLLARELVAPCMYVRTYVCTTRNFNEPAKWQFEVITHVALCQISIFRLLNIQYTYSENGTQITGAFADYCTFVT